MLYWFIDQIMFDILRRLRRPKRSCWIFVMTDEYLMGYHATDRYERVLTTGCTFDGLNKLEGWKRWKTGTLKNGFVASLEDLRSCITGFLDEYERKATGYQRDDETYQKRAERRITSVHHRNNDGQEHEEGTYQECLSHIE